MIVSAVVCPHPPLLLREVSGAEDAVPELRAACHAALAAALRAALEAGVDAVAVIGGADVSGAWDPALPVGVRRFGTTAAPDVASLPQSLGVATRLLDEVSWSGARHLQAVAWDASADEAAETAGRAAATGPRVLLLVMADGSARRGEKAPGHLDERAFVLDDEIGRALDEGDAPALERLDAELADELLAQGRAALAVLGVAARDRPVASRTSYRDDPYGVMYTVASWDLGAPADLSAEA